FQAEDGIRDFHVTGVQTCALPIFNNNAGNGPEGLSQLVAAGRVRRMICSFARSSNKLNPNAVAFADAYRQGKIELECVPQGTMEIGRASCRERGEITDVAVRVQEK